MQEEYQRDFPLLQVHFSVVYREIVQHLLEQCLNPKLTTYLFLFFFLLESLHLLNIHQEFPQLFHKLMFLGFFLENLLSHFITLRLKHANIVSIEKMKLRESSDVDIESDASSQKQKKCKDAMNAILPAVNAINNRNHLIRHQAEGIYATFLQLILRWVPLCFRLHRRKCQSKWAL